MILNAQKGGINTLCYFNRTISVCFLFIYLFRMSFIFDNYNMLNTKTDITFNPGTTIL